MLIGKSASPGIAIGKALVLRDQEIRVEDGFAKDLEREVVRFNDAVQASKKEIQRLHDRVLTKLGPDKAQIFEAHLMILEDPELIDSVISTIRDEKFKATKALHLVAQNFISMFESMEEEYLRERALDIRDVTGRLHRNLLGIKSIDLGSLQEPVIIVANDITPSQMASVDLQYVLGLVTEIGGKTSHTAIMARTLELPAVVGLKEATLSLKDGEIIIVDGEAGEVSPDPDPDTLRIYEARRQKHLSLKQDLQRLVGQDSRTLDGHAVFLEANIASAMDLESVMKNDAQGIGLFRTEFIYMDRTSAPCEDEQFEIYKKVLERMNGRPTVIRTLDVGGDKNISYLKIPKEENPFLGFRAIRYCLQHPDLFKQQLRALLRSANHGNLWIMFPMISNVQEVLQAKELLEEARKELTAAGISVPAKVKTGIMIEIPAAAILADQLAKHVDFFSIGTNDLIQYVCAVDRMNENVHDLYDPFHPGVLRLIDQVIKAGQKAKVDVGMCGEMASNELLTEVLLGMGLTHFSMAPSSILRTRQKVRQSDLSQAKKLAQHVLSLATGEEIRSYLEKHQH